MKSYVYGIENKEGFYWNFAKKKFAMWSPQCSLPTEELADDIHITLIDSGGFENTNVVPVSTES